jgi:hypothetical protein
VPESGAKKLTSRQHYRQQYMMKVSPERVNAQSLTAKPTVGGLYWKGQRDGNNF